MHCLSNGQRTRRGVGVRGAIAILAMTIVALGACQRSSEPPEREVLLGGLFSLTGDWSNLGQTGRAAMEIAVEDVNRYLTRNPAGVRLVAAIEDTRLEPGLALEWPQSSSGRAPTRCWAR